LANPGTYFFMNAASDIACRRHERRFARRCGASGGDVGAVNTCDTCVDLAIG